MTISSGPGNFDPLGLYIPEQWMGTPVDWQLSSDNRSSFPATEDGMNDSEMIIRAPWGATGAERPVYFALSLVFEGITTTPGAQKPYRGLFSTVITPEDGELIACLREKPKRGKSPREYLKEVAITLAKFPMYPGARITILVAHCGHHGIMTHTEFSSVCGWETLVARRNAEIARFEARQGWLRRFIQRLRGIPAELGPEILPTDPPEDIWNTDAEIQKAITALGAGVGLNSGPLKLGAESAMRKLCRGPRIQPVASQYHLKGPQTIVSAGRTPFTGRGVALTTRLDIAN